MAAFRRFLTERAWTGAVALATALAVLWALAGLAGTGDARYALATFAALAGGGALYLTAYHLAGAAHRRALWAFARRRGMSFAPGPVHADPLLRVPRLPLVRALARHFDADTLYWKLGGPGPAAMGPVLEGRAALFARVPWALEYDRTAPTVTRVGLFGRAAVEPVRVFPRHGFTRSALGDQVLDRVEAGSSRFDARFVVYARRPADAWALLTRDVCDALCGAPPLGPGGLWIGPYGCAVHLPGRALDARLLDAWAAALEPLATVLFRGAPVLLERRRPGKKPGANPGVRAHAG